MDKFEAVNRRALKIYDDAVAKGRNEHERVLWFDQVTQYYRFHEICHFLGDLTRPGLEILDVGCGNGELFKFLKFSGFCGRYRGIDIHDGMLNEARGRFSSVDFQRADILNDEVTPAHFVVMSGLFNIDAGYTGDFIAEFIAAMWRSAKEAVIFNAISTFVNYRDDEMFYLDLREAINCIAKLSHRFEVRHGFLPYNYTVCIHKNADWESA